MTDSAIKSLIVKSVRVGWLDGIIAAVKMKNEEFVINVINRQFVEDIFPAIQDFENLIKKLKNADYETVLAYETHHGRGYTDQFCDLEKEAC